MLLPRGVTGFWGRKEGPPSFSNYAAFRGHCYEVSRLVGASVRNISVPSEATFRNYALAVIAFPDAAVAVVLNGVLPLLAFAVPPPDGQLLLDFTDSPDLAAQFERFGGYTLLKAADLVQPLTREMWRELAPHEQKLVKYFRPQRVGDVVFNCWD